MSLVFTILRRECNRYPSCVASAHVATHSRVVAIVAIFLFGTVFDYTVYSVSDLGDTFSRHRGGSRSAILSREQSNRPRARIRSTTYRSYPDGIIFVFLERRYFEVVGSKRYRAYRIGWNGRYVYTLRQHVLPRGSRRFVSKTNDGSVGRSSRNDIYIERRRYTACRYAFYQYIVDKIRIRSALRYCTNIAVAESDITIVAVVGNCVEVYGFGHHSTDIVTVVERSDRYERITVGRVGHIAHLQRTAFVMLFVQVESQL